MSKAPGGPPNNRRRQTPTREGWWFLAATLLVGAAAIDAGINLYFLTFGMMVCLLVAGVALSELGLAGLRVRRVLPPAIHAGTPYLMGIALENRKRRLPSFSIEVEDLVDGRPIEKRCYFLKLPAGRLQETAYRNTIARRGRYRLTGFRLATKFPFGLWPRARTVVDADELFVYPALIPPSEALLRGLPAHPAAGRSFAPSRQGEFRGLRAFRSGDDPRDIHWRTSARRGLMLVREKEDEETRAATVVLDNDPAAGQDPTAFERAVSEAAGISVELVQRGFSVGLAVRGGEVRADVGGAQVERILRALAVIAPDAGPLPAVRAGMVVRVRPGVAPALETSGAPAREDPRMRWGGA
ncbi:MAG TPA: DUF58 domain-containing protein [Polyangia bacterium]|jgi:uncharacterized protein (DUF58 family)